jgi:hypothetical protein
MSKGTELNRTVADREYEPAQIARKIVKRIIAATPPPLIATT